MMLKSFRKENVENNSIFSRNNEYSKKKKKITLYKHDRVVGDKMYTNPGSIP